jgi:hypothetical protein
LGNLRFNAKAAIPSLIGLLGDEEHRRDVVVALGKIGPQFMELLSNADEGTQTIIVSAIEEIGPGASPAVPRLTTLLIHGSVSMRRAAARILGKIGPKARAAVPALCESVKDKDVLLCWTAAKALGEVGLDAKTSAPALTELLKDKNGEVRDAAASALRRNTLEARTSEVDAKKIRRLIAELATVDEPDVGFSPTVGGSAFAPIASSEQLGTFLVTDPGLKRNTAFTSLVELGPQALPFLLESLDDKTPTKLIMGHPTMMGDMWLSHEIEGNPLNSHEANVLSEVGAPLEEQGYETHVNRYTARVGDICFVAIGQIANRPYMAVRYQPTGCTVVNSTVFDKTLAAEVRAIWGKSDHRQKLLDWLLVDFRTLDCRFNGFPAGAAMRLAYYFPDATEDLIIARLNELEAAAAGNPQRSDDVSR